MNDNLIFMGTPEFAVPALEALLEQGWPVRAVVAQPDRPSGRHMRLTAPPVKALALRYEIPVLQPQKLRDPGFVEQLRAFAPRVIVTAAYGRILPPAVLTLPPGGCLNLHASLLPAYRGAAPIQWAIIRGETETGVTLMRMDEGLDTGSILTQRSLPIGADVRADELAADLAALAARMIGPELRRYLDGQLPEQPQDSDRATQAPMLARENGWINWSCPAAVLHNRVRGMFPWPGAYTTALGKRLKVLRSRPSDRDSTGADIRCDSAGADISGYPPGTICRLSGEAISVSCGDGILDLLELQQENSRPMSSRECWHNYRIGQRLGGPQI